MDAIIGSGFDHTIDRSEIDLTCLLARQSNALIHLLIAGCPGRGGRGQAMGGWRDVGEAPPLSQGVGYGICLGE